MSHVTIPKIFMAGGVVGFSYYLVMRQYWFPNPYKLREAQRLEEAARLGDANSADSRQLSGSKGPE